MASPRALLGPQVSFTPHVFMNVQPVHKLQLLFLLRAGASKRALHRTHAFACTCRDATPQTTQASDTQTSSTNAQPSTSVDQPRTATRQPPPHAARRRPLAAGQRCASRHGRNLMSARRRYFSISCLLATRRRRTSQHGLLLLAGGRPSAAAPVPSGTQRTRSQHAAA